MNTKCNSGSKLKGIVDEHSGHYLRGHKPIKQDNIEFLYNELFRKELTPTDVGIYSRFRYRYCKNSQSYLFTTGWINFVKNKGLRAKNKVVFNSCESMNGTKVNTRNTFVIDVVKNIKVLPLDQQEEIIDQDADANLVPVYLFGKQIGWTEKKKR
uniref:TF-B3 domain-containing protein n=1 Tax=Solanum lycopersicum TaxID=4081 RepID=A0A3Q7JA35_SOLLC